MNESRAHEAKRCTKCSEQYPATTKFFHLNSGKLYPSCRACRTTTSAKRTLALAKMHAPDGHKVCTSCLKSWPDTADYFHREGVKSSRPRSQCLWCKAHPSRKDLVLAQMQAPDGLRVCSSCLIPKPATTENFSMVVEYQWLMRKCKKCQCEQARLWARQNWEQKREYNSSEVVKERKRRHRTMNLERYRELARAGQNRRRALELRAEGTCDSKDIALMYEQQHGLCCYCETQLHQSYHIEHIVPLSRGGSNSPENIALACASCNSRKASRTLMEFLPRLGYLTVSDAA